MKWWFALPVLGCTSVSVVEMFYALGLGSPATPYSFSKTLLFFLLFYSFSRLYSLVLWAVLPNVERQNNGTPPERGN
jgi:hypothetical protein